MKGHFTQHTKESKALISQSRKGQCLGNKNALGNIPWNKGKKNPGVGGVKKGNIPWNKGKHLSESHRLKAIKNLIPAKNGNKLAYRDGRTPSILLLRVNNNYKFWRKSVFERDDYTCLSCGVRGGRLEAHHIIPVRDTCSQEFLPIIYCEDNGVTLCQECHNETKHGREHLFVERFTELVAKQYRL